MLKIGTADICGPSMLSACGTLPVSRRADEVRRLSCCSLDWRLLGVVKRLVLSLICVIAIIQLSEIPPALGDDSMQEPSIVKELDVAFTAALKTINDERSRNSANGFGCTQYFSDFYRLKKIDRYVAYFRNKGIAAVAIDQNQQHFVYFTLTYEQLRAWGYRRFMRGDHIVLVFTTASPSSTDIKSFSANLIGRTFP